MAGEEAMSHRRQEGSKHCRGLLGARVRDDRGQSLILIVLAMSLVMVMAAFAIDAAEWQVGHHKAQVTADAAALAAANCLASMSCSSSDVATQKADTIANDNGFATGNLNISFTSSTVTATITTSEASTFGGFAGITSTRVAASATASYSTLSQYTPTCSKTGAANCYSLFAANPNCDSSPSIPSNYVGLDLVTNDNGGGSGNLSEVFTNGYYWNGGNTNASTYVITTVGTNSPPCNDRPPPKGTNSYKWVPNITPYPEPWTEPSCDHTAASWTTTSIAASGPGVYCVSATPTACSDAATGSGDIDVNMSSLSAGGYEFVGPCVTVAGQSTTATNMSGQPLVYGTSNIATVNSKPAFATATALPTCTTSANTGASGTTTYLDGTPTAGPAIYDQCGTVEVANNGGYTGFVEAWNISVDKNNAVTGNGPTSVLGGGITYVPGGDQLTQ